MIQGMLAAQPAEAGRGRGACADGETSRRPRARIRPGRGCPRSTSRRNVDRTAHGQREPWRPSHHLANTNGPGRRRRRPPVGITLDAVVDVSSSNAQIVETQEATKQRLLSQIASCQRQLDRLRAVSDAGHSPEYLGVHIPVGWPRAASGRGVGQRRGLTHSKRPRCRSYCDQAWPQRRRKLALGTLMAGAKV